MTGTATTAGAVRARPAGKCLTFKLGAEEFGFDILRVQEIIKMMEITRVPRTPDFVRGVVNLRGKVIPIVDLRLKFGMAARETTDKTCVIVVQVQRGGSNVTMGVIVDEVSEVLDILEDQIELPPDLGGSSSTAFIRGIGKVAKRVIILLDADAVLSSNEIEALSQAQLASLQQAGNERTASKR